MSKAVYPIHREGSHVVQISPTERLGHLLALQYLTDPANERTNTGARPNNNKRVILKEFLYNSAAVFLGYKHFNERRGDILPELPAMLKGCDFHWTFEFRDTQASGFEAAKQLSLVTGQIDNFKMKATRSAQKGKERQLLTNITIINHNNNHVNTHGDNGNQNHGDSNNPYWQLPPEPTATSPSTTATSASTSAPASAHPFAIMGAYWSSVSKPLSILSGALEIPQVSGTSSSAALNDNLYFARTMATNDGDAKATIRYYHQIGVANFACLYLNDSWGVNYHASLQQNAYMYGITIKSFPYDKCCFETAVADLAKSGYRHVFALMHNWELVLEEALHYDIIGRPEYAWMVAEQKKWTGQAFSVPADKPDLARALHGIGTLNIYFEPVPALEEALEAFAFDTALQQEFISTQANPTLFEGYEFPSYDPTGFTSPIFDAMITLGLTACNVTSIHGDHTMQPTQTSDNETSLQLPPLFTGPEFYRKLVETTSFLGVSGHVSFDPQTGTRRHEAIKYSVENILLSDTRTTADAFRYEATLAAVVGPGEALQQLTPFVYFDNTTNLPPPLPPIPGGVDMNLVPGGVQAVGYSLASIVILSSLGFLAWTIRCRNLFVVRASQPIFLGQLCIGTFVMAMSVFPASLPGASTHTGPDLAMDVACMSQLWLVFLGFVTAFSAIFSKTYRLNQLMNSGMRRIQIDARDVMWPFYLLMLANAAMLLCISIVSPYQYARVNVDSYDEFGRSTESYGTCQPKNKLFYVFFGILVCSDAVGVLVALYQAWKGRNLPTEFSESFYLALSLASFTETLILGGPILGVVYTNPSGWYLMSSIILCVGCMTILLPLMLPKYFGRNFSGKGTVVASVSESVGRRRDGISGLDDSKSITAGASSTTTGTLGKGMMTIQRKSSMADSSSNSARPCRRQGLNESGHEPSAKALSVIESIQQMQSLGAAGFEMSDSEESGNDDRERMVSFAL